MKAQEKSNANTIAKARASGLEGLMIYVRLLIVTSANRALLAIDKYLSSMK